MTELYLGAMALSNGGRLPDDLKITGQTEEWFPILSSDKAGCSVWLFILDLGLRKQRRKTKNKKNGYNQ